MQELAAPPAKNPIIKLPPVKLVISGDIISYHAEMLNSDWGRQKILEFVGDVYYLKSLPYAHSPEAKDGGLTKTDSAFIDLMVLFLLQGTLPQKAPSGQYEIRKVLIAYTRASEHIQYVLGPIVTWWKLWAYCDDVVHVRQRPT